jgi:Xaa-Pro aminopeptidase
MSELDVFLNDNDADTELVRTLRKALRDAEKERKDLQTQLAERTKADRTRNLADVLKEKGLSEKVAKLYPGDAEPTAEAVDAWLAEYGDVFGIEQPGTAADAETVTAAQRIANASAGAPPAHTATDISSLMAEIKSAKTPEEYQAALAKLGMGR